MQFKISCPHCLGDRAGFETVYQWPERGYPAEAFLAAICGICNNGIIVSVTNLSGGTFPDAVRGNFQFPSDVYRLVHVWPSAELIIPEDLPSNVESFYRQGLKNRAGRNWDAAGAMFRKTLDVATKQISPSEKDLTLFGRINSLTKRRQLTEAMGEWSHEIRIDGNEAVHDELPETSNDVNALQKFTEVFLTYAFTLPNLVERNRQKRNSNDEHNPA